jgi:4-hydroxythreonine-4-phosphate dehydrogenase
MATPLRLAVTLGDPRGIGPEIVIAARSDAALAAAAELVLVGPTGTIAEVDESIGAWKPLGGETDRAAEAGRLAGLAIERAVELAQSGSPWYRHRAPIDKAALLAGGYDFLATPKCSPRSRARRWPMLACVGVARWADDPRRVILATTHLPLRFLDAVTAEAIVDAADVTRHGLIDWFGIARSDRALCAQPTRR